MTSFMLYDEPMNATIHLNLAVQMTGRFFATSMFLLALAAGNLDLASSALPPNGAGGGMFSESDRAVNRGWLVAVRG
jgi:hypothetical protein